MSLTPTRTPMKTLLPFLWLPGICPAIAEMAAEFGSIGK